MVVLYIFFSIYRYGDQSNLDRRRKLMNIYQARTANNTFPVRGGMKWVEKWCERDAPYSGIDVGRICVCVCVLVRSVIIGKREWLTDWLTVDIKKSTWAVYWARIMEWLEGVIQDGLRNEKKRESYVCRLSLSEKIKTSFSVWNVDGAAVECVGYTGLSCN